MAHLRNDAATSQCVWIRTRDRMAFRPCVLPSGGDVRTNRRDGVPSPCAVRVGGARPQRGLGIPPTREARSPGWCRMAAGSVTGGATFSPCPTGRWIDPESFRPCTAIRRPARRAESPADTTHCLDPSERPRRHLAFRCPDLDCSGTIQNRRCSAASEKASGFRPATRC